MAFIKINGKQIADAAISNNHVSPTAAIAETKLAIDWNAHTEILVDKKVIYKVQINDQEVGGVNQLNVNSLVSGSAVLSTGSNEGIITDAPKNKVLVRDGATKDSPFKDAEGNVVYGRMVQESGQYVVKFYTEVGGVDTAFTMPASKTVDLVYYKRGNLYNVPEDYAISDGGSFVEGATDVIAEFNINQLAQELGITLGNDGEMTLTRSIIDEILVQTRGIVNDDVRANETIDEVVTARSTFANLNARLTGIESDLSAEETARENADNTLQSNITSEANTRATADTTLQNNINSEATARQNADNTLQSNINAEQSAREASDAQIISDLASSAENKGASTVGVESGSGLTGSNVQSVLENLEGRLAAQEVGGGAEVTATHTRDSATTNGVFGAGSFSDLESRIVNIESTVDAQVTDLAGDIASETSRATAAEEAIAEDLADEVSRATAAENAIASDLADEISRATGAEATIASNLASEVTRATAAESAIASDLADEVARATAAEGVLTSNLASEVTRATNAENAIASDLSDEITRATAAEAAIASDLADEVSDRIAAVSAEQTARENADEAITDRIDVSLNANGTLKAGTQIHDHFKYVFAAVGGETSVSLTGGQKFQYGDDSLDVYINGVLQAEGYHYTETQDSGNAALGIGVSFAPESLLAGDVVILKWYINNAE